MKDKYNHLFDVANYSLYRGGTRPSKSFFLTSNPKNDSNWVLQFAFEVELRRVLSELNIETL